MSFQEVMQSVLDFLNSPIGITGISGLTLGGIGLSIIKILKPTTKRQKSIESHLATLSTAYDAQSKRIDELEGKLKAYETANNERVVAIASVSPNAKIRNLALSIKAEDIKNASNVVKAVIEEAPKVIEATKKVLKVVAK